MRSEPDNVAELLSLYDEILIEEELPLKNEQHNDFLEWDLLMKKTLNVGRKTMED